MMVNFLHEIKAKLLFILMSINYTLNSINSIDQLVKPNLVVEMEHKFEEF